MFTVRYEDLHREHHNLISKIDYWKDKLKFLNSILEKLQVSGVDPEDLTSQINSLHHLKRHLGNLQVQIQSHESFLKSYAVDDGLALMLDEKDHSMEHMRQFEAKFHEVYNQIMDLKRAH